MNNMLPIPPIKGTRKLRWLPMMHLIEATVEYPSEPLSQPSQPNRVLSGGHEHQIRFCQHCNVSKRSQARIDVIVEAKFPRNPMVCMSTWWPVMNLKEGFWIHSFF